MDLGKCDGSHLNVAETGLRESVRPIHLIGLVVLPLHDVLALLVALALIVVRVRLVAIVLLLITSRPGVVHTMTNRFLALVYLRLIVNVLALAVLGHLDRNILDNPCLYHTILRLGVLFLRKIVNGRI